MAQSDALFIGIKGTVLALDRATGTELWRRELSGGEFVNIALKDGDLFAATEGKVYCLDPGTGHIRWHNPLKGLGFGLVTIAGADQQQVIAMRNKQEQEKQETSVASM